MSLEEKLIQEAVNLLGNPINDWEFTAIEFNDDTPHLRYYPSTGQISISLSMKAKEDKGQYVFQLTHELCHLFYPRKAYPSLIEHRSLTINEGIATYFSVKTTGSMFNNEDHLRNDLKHNSSKYFNALELVEKLLALDPKAITKLRNEQPRLDLLSESDFNKTNIKADPDLIKSLLTPFD